jgi:hypothetical protein
MFEALIAYLLVGFMVAMFCALDGTASAHADMTMKTPLPPVRKEGA